MIVPSDPEVIATPTGRCFTGEDKLHILKLAEVCTAVGSLGALLRADLGVTKTHSRLYTSDDNPFSEAQFKTLKYRPDFPERFGSLKDARAFCQTFFAWYNGERESAVCV
jgi:transposase InsO family protein